MRSKPLDTIIAEARALVNDGCFELNLIGQDTTSFGYDIGYERGLVGLLESLDSVLAEAGGGWARLMYAYPTFFDDEMIDAIARLPNIVNYIDIPLQHASDSMLDKMRRNVRASDQQALIEKLRQRIPGMAIRTTFITGFPGETADDHAQLLDFIEAMQFDAMGVFQYSPEPGTPAGTMDRDSALHVPDELKAERESELMLLQQSIAFENAAYMAEQTAQLDVLVDEAIAAEDDDVAGVRLYRGRAFHQAPQVDSCTIIQSSATIAPGELIRCTIVGSEGYDLIAQPTEELHRGFALPVVS